MKSELKRIESVLQQVASRAVVEPECQDDIGAKGKKPNAENGNTEANAEQVASEQICHQAMANPAVANRLLQDLQSMVSQLIQSNQEVSQQIQILYGEGPIVNGWLESSNSQEYQLCGLDENGQIWRRACPADQVPDIGLAIVRYQRLQQLMAQKQSSDQHVIHLTQGLLEVHQQMTKLNHSCLI
jgi:hypothetical protein